MMETEQARKLATAIAEVMPGWSAEWRDTLVGAYLVNGDMRIFLSVQTGWGHKRGMIRIVPQLPRGDAWEDPDNKSDAIYVGESRSPEVFAREITRRVIDQQDYPAKVARQVAMHATYKAAADSAADFARELSGVLGVEPRDTQVYAYPHGDWQVSSTSARLDIYLPREVALKVARVIMEEM